MRKIGIMPESGSGGVESPCVRNCCLDDDDICLGCFRSLAEITGWNEADDAERCAVLDRTRQRREAHRAKYGG